MASFKVPCPSCEAPVLIKNPNLVGTKVECPKCKYRFKVEDPSAAGDAKDAKKGDAKDKKADKKAAAGTPGKKKKLLPILGGVGAVVVLIVVGVMAFGGKKKQPPYVPTNPVNSTQTPPQEEKKDGTVEPPVVNGVTGSAKITSNLLPAQTVAVYRVNLDKARESPAYGALFDAPVSNAFEQSMGFTVYDVEAYLHCFAGDGRDPFGVIRLKTPTKADDLTAAMRLTTKSEDVKGRALYASPPNPFVKAVSHALSMQALFGDFYDRVPMARPLGTESKPMGVCVYDTQHVLIGEYALLKQFLGTLDANGNPPFQTVMLGGAAPPASPGADKAFTSVDAYRTIEYPLKKALDELEADKTAVPMLVYAERFVIREYDPKLMKKEYSVLAGLLDPIAVHAKYVSGNVVTFSAERLVANLRVTLGSADDARAIAEKQLSPGLSTLTDVLKLYLTTPIVFNDYTVAGAPPGIPGIPGGPGGPGGPGAPPPPATGGPGGMIGPRRRPAGPAAAVPVPAPRRCPAAVKAPAVAAGRRSCRWAAPAPAPAG